MKQKLIIVLLFLLLTGTVTSCADPSQVVDPHSNTGGSQDLVEKTSNGDSSFDLRVSYIDVGQGDSTFIELPNGQTMLIDAGEPQYGDTVAAHIKQGGYTKIDYVIGTHPHSDHVGGLVSIIKDFEIGTIYMPKVSHNSQLYENLLLAIQDKGLKIKTAKEGVSILEDGDLSARFLAPCSDSYSDLNNYSAVVKLTYGENRFLFMGDAEMVSENEITEDLSANVLKAGHHGSTYSTGDGFLSKVSPEYAVISCGKGNQYGHPSPEILSKLNQAGITIFRTDEQGTIVFNGNGSEIKVDKAESPVQENAPPSVAAASPLLSSSQETSTEVTVYITETGSKYHSDGCQYLKKSQIAISLDEAKKSYEPCSKCHPPQ